LSPWLPCSGDEDDDEEPLDWLPIAPEIEDPDEAGWGQLEVRYMLRTALQCYESYVAFYNLYTEHMKPHGLTISIWKHVV